MATTKCPECSSKISDQAMSCPKCGKALKFCSAFNDCPSPNAGNYTQNTNIYTKNMLAGFKNRLAELLRN